jgi:sec-independent protein translocase protein TatB
MFNIGFSELIIVLLIAFLVVGPKDLPRVARWLGRSVKKLRQMIQEVKKETGWADLEKEYKDTKNDVDKAVKDLKNDLDVTKELKGAADDVNKSVKSVADELHAAGKDIEAETKEIREETMKK